MRLGRFVQRGSGRAGGGILSRLLRDARGNTLIIVAASLLPLLCLVGSGIDMGRGYLAQNRLQQACDAGVLAGRRAMSGGTVDSAVIAEANKFFAFNFPTGTDGVDGTAAFRSKGFRPVVGTAANSTVTINAATVLPTTIMKIFGFNTLPLSVSCFAKQDFVNTDILLVLDTTGSMACASSEANCAGSSTGAEKSTSKIRGLRDAVLALYDQLADTQATLESQGLRLRYGIVPYSSAVNVGGIVSSVDADYINDTAPYQTRTGNYTQEVYVPSGTATTTSQTLGFNVTAANCNLYGYNQGFTQSNAGTFTPNPAGEPIAATTLTYWQPATWGGSTTISGTGNKACVRTRIVYPRYTSRYAFAGFVYERHDIATDQYKRGNSVSVAIPESTGVLAGTMPARGTYDAVDIAANATRVFAVPTGVNASRALIVPAQIAGTATNTQSTISTESQTWSGCIEERKTTSSITSSSSSTSGAYDLDIDADATSQDTRWTPHWPEMIWYRELGSFYGSSYRNQAILDAWSPPEPYVACPSPAVRLQPWTRSALSTYLNSLRAIGGTYHDIGMIWGARMISPDGIFAADNPTTFGSMPVSRFIIFLTDGQMAPNAQTYTSYGVEYLDQRVTGSSSANNQLNDHNARMEIACSAARSKASVWVIAFATTLNSQLTDCADNENQAKTVNDSAALIAAFKQIGKDLGALRLVPQS